MTSPTVGRSGTFAAGLVSLVVFVAVAGLVSVGGTVAFKIIEDCQYRRSALVCDAAGFVLMVAGAALAMLAPFLSGVYGLVREQRARDGLPWLLAVWPLWALIQAVPVLVAAVMT